MKTTVIFAVALCLTISSCSDSKNTASSIAKTATPGVLTVCTDMPYEPFEFTEGDNPRGIDVDLTREIAKDIHLKTDYKNTDFDSIFDRLTDRSCDLVASAVSITDERSSKYLFSDGYFEVNQSLMVRTSDASKYASLEALSDRTIGVQKGTTGAQYAANHSPRSKIREFEDAAELVRALDSKDVDAVLQDFPINSYLAHKSTDRKVVQSFNDVPREQYGFAMGKDNSALRDAVDKALREIRSDGRYDRILGRYLGEVAAGN